MLYSRKARKLLFKGKIFNGFLFVKNENKDEKLEWSDDALDEVAEAGGHEDSTSSTRSGKTIRRSTGIKSLCEMAIKNGKT